MEITMSVICKFPKGKPYIFSVKA